MSRRRDRRVVRVLEWIPEMIKDRPPKDDLYRFDEYAAAHGPSTKATRIARETMTSPQCKLAGYENKAGA